MLTPELPEALPSFMFSCDTTAGSVFAPPRVSSVQLPSSCVGASALSSEPPHPESRVTSATSTVANRVDPGGAFHGGLRFRCCGWVP